MSEHEYIVQNEQFDKQFQKLPPQVKIYNRNFYLRRDQHENLIKQREREIYQLSSKPKVSAQSYSILTQKLQKDLAILIEKYSVSQRIDYSSFHKIVQQLGKFDTSNQILKKNLQQILTQLWLLLVEYDLDKEDIQANQIERLLIILFCPHSLRQQEIVTLLEEIFPNLDNSRMAYIQEYPDAKEEILTLEEIVEIWLKIKHTQFATVKKAAPIKEVNRDAFRPQINSKSRQYAQKSLQKYLSTNRIDNLKDSKLNQLSGYISSGGRQLSYHQILYRRGLQKEQLMKTSRQQVQLHKQKTLTTEQVKRLVSNLYIMREKKEDVDYQKIKEEQELKLCTFKPSTITYQKRNSIANIKNYNKEVQRLQKGRREKQKRKQAFQNLGRVKNKNSVPPSFIEREKPRLILQIKVGDKIEQLKLKGEQDPRLVAKKFIRMHGLPQQMQQVLESIIQQQLNAL